MLYAFFAAFHHFIHRNNKLRIIIGYLKEISEFSFPHFFVGDKISNLHVEPVPAFMKHAE